MVAAVDCHRASRQRDRKLGLDQLTREACLRGMFGARGSGARHTKG
jgi:hypothetical protein